MRRLAVTVALGALLASCAEAPRPVVLHPADQPPARLSDWGLFVGDGDGFGLNAGVIPYDLNTPLFTDYALKLRTVWMPEGEGAGYRERGELENTDILHDYMRQSRLKIVPLGRGDAWLDAGTPEMLLEASNFVRTIERRQGLKIACLEEIAFNMGLIDDARMQQHIDKYKKCEYGDYLQKVKDGLFQEASDYLERLVKEDDVS